MDYDYDILSPQEQDEFDELMLDYWNSGLYYNYDLYTNDWETVI